MSLAAATRSELTKQFTTNLWWILALMLVILVGGVAAAAGWGLGATATGVFGGDPSPLTGGQDLVYGMSESLGYIFALLLGTIMVTNEFRHKTLVPTFLAVPKRGKALFAKIVAGTLLGLLYAVIALVAAVAPSAAFLAAYGQETVLAEPETWALFGRVVIALVLWTLIGVGIGTLVRNQAFAIVSVLTFTQFVEPIARIAANFVEGLGNVVAYLPGAASAALTGSSIFQLTSSTGAEALEWWQGGVVLAAYAVVLLILGYIASWRRDAL